MNKGEYQMKKIVTLFSTGVLSLFLLLLLSTPISAKGDESDKNFTDEVRENFEIINEKYEIGEPFSEEDAHFIKENSVYIPEYNVFVPNVNSQIQPMDLAIGDDGYWGVRGSSVKGVLLGTKLTTYGLIGSSGTYVGITSSTARTKTFAGGSEKYRANLSNANYVLLTAWAYGNSWIEIDTSNCSLTRSVF